MLVSVDRVNPVSMLVVSVERVTPVRMLVVVGAVYVVGVMNVIDEEDDQTGVDELQAGTLELEEQG